MSAAVSFEILGNHPSDVCRGVERTVEQLDGRVGGGVLFLCGTLARQLLDVAMMVRELGLEAPMLLATGTGVLTDRGEHEQVSACAGLLWQAGRCVPFAMNKPGDEPLSDRLAAAVEQASGPRQHPVLMFASREAVNPAELFDANRPQRGPLFGGGTIGRPGAVVVSGKRVLAADVAGMALQGAGRAVVKASPACQVLGKPQPVTATDGALVLSIA